MKFLIALTILTIALILAPAIIALPPVNQTPAMLAAAHLAQALAPITSVALAALAAIQLWRRRTWRTTALLAVALGCVALSRINLLERVFAPALNVETTSIGNFHDVRDTDMVIGVVIGGKSRAYPVRYLAYHHMLNDQVGSTALLPTY
jgi:Protein of unknown function (DUF3179)